ncbi:GNAT family N-acetyltransferase [Methylibium sp. Root1272]|uniref:GNAT family N-acetyltransferase n=1 Tax=Methylibium sp. Root1272 TaxID=1736441 RepID=UPI0007020692|nr:GNAT family N-acyltransferase [Methylibium sp. Root1272]KQW73665.1 ornithine-acyl-ACP acyltransferase [Methylibium sp. Root1272]
MRDLPLPTLPLQEIPSLELRAPRRSLRRPGGEALPAASQCGLDVVWARDESEVREAQRLRYQIFVEEMGARLSPPAGTPAGLDIDVYDAFCEHLLVRTVGAHGEPGRVIGTYRVLTPAAARRIGGLYSETEFDLTRLRPLRGKMVELGRSCVHADHRSGGAILALWGALAEFMVRNELDTMIGCASISMRDGGHVAASLWEQLRHTHLAPIEWQVRPRLPLPVDELDRHLAVEPPPLIKGYLRCGAKVLGAPAWDPDFNTADLPMLMRIDDLPLKYRRHFLGH